MPEPSNFFVPADAASSRQEPGETSRAQQENEARLERIKTRMCQTELGRAVVDFMRTNDVSADVINDCLQPSYTDDRAMSQLAYTMDHVRKREARNARRIPAPVCLSPEAAIAFSRLIDGSAFLFRQKFVEHFAAKTGDRGPLDALAEAGGTVPPAPTEAARVMAHIGKLVNSGFADAGMIQIILKEQERRDAGGVSTMTGTLLSYKQSVALVLAQARQMDDSAWPVPSEGVPYLSGLSDEGILAALMTPPVAWVRQDKAADIQAMFANHARQLAQQAEQDRQDNLRLSHLKQMIGQTPMGAALLEFAHENNIEMKFDRRLKEGVGGNYHADIVRLKAGASDDELIGTIAHELFHAMQDKKMSGMLGYIDGNISPDAALGVTRLVEGSAYLFEWKFLEDFAAKTGNRWVLETLKNRPPASCRSDAERLEWYVTDLARYGSEDKKTLDNAEVWIKRHEDGHSSVVSRPMLSRAQSNQVVIDVARRIVDDGCWPFKPAPGQQAHYLEHVGDEDILRVATAAVHPEIVLQVTELNARYDRQYAKQQAAASRARPRPAPG